MLRTAGDPELRVFDSAIRFLHWLTLFLIVAVFVLAVSIDFASPKPRLLRSCSCIARSASACGS